MPSLAARQKALELVRQARGAMVAGQWDHAEDLARQAEQLRLPETAFAPGEDRPSLVLFDLRQLRQRGSANVVPASGQFPVTAAGGAVMDRNASRAVYDPANDPTRNVQAANQQPTPRAGQRSPASAEDLGLQTPQIPPETMVAPTPAPPPAMTSASAAASTPAKVPAMVLFEQGETALKAHDTDRAYQLFLQAAAQSNELDPGTAQRLQDHLQLLSVPSRTRLQQRRRLHRSLTKRPPSSRCWRARSRRTWPTRRPTPVPCARRIPRARWLCWKTRRRRLRIAGLEPAARERLTRQVDRAIADTKQFIDQNRPQLELAEKNNRTRQEVDREQRTKVVVQEKLALLVNDCNRLMDEQRYEEAQVAAKQAADLDPKNPVVVQLLWQTKFVRRYMEAKAIKDQQEEGFIAALNEVDHSAIPFAGDKNPMVFSDAKQWNKLTASRQKFRGDNKLRRTEQEIEIEKKLRTPVSLQFKDAPLREVMDVLAKLAEVNLYLDPQGLAEEGVARDTTVTIQMRREIMLKSALNLILEPLHLSYVIKDEVLKITSEQMRDGQLVTHTYNVADLVVPIPNFVPQPMGEQAAYNTAMANLGLGGGGGLPFGSSTAMPMGVVASRDGKGGSGTINSGLLAQCQQHAATAGPRVEGRARGNWPRRARRRLRGRLQ